jgi:ABC-type branched-subunit amino acid transport system substrate-binding protein
MKYSRARRVAAVLGAAALVATACAVDDDTGDDAAPETTTEDEAEEAPETDEIAFDIGVTEEPCPNAVNADNGCIYLGILSDLSEGPFAPLAIHITAAQEAFWQNVNEEGGIGGFDVDVSTYIRDTLYDPQEHAARYREIEPNILALAQTLGTTQTEAILADMDSDNVIGAPAAWYSGFSFEEFDRGLILESGYSYCIESMIGLDWFTENVGEPSSVVAVGYPNDYGLDSAAGVALWAEANGVEFTEVETAPDAVVGSQDAAVAAIMGSGAEVVVLAVGPAEAASIVGMSAAAGFEGQFLGSVPTWNVALLDSPAGPALEALYTNVSPWEGIDGTSTAHDKIRESLGGEPPANDAYIYGWVWSYPIRAALEAAAANGDLTREGVRSVVDGLEVDYEGALPSTVFGGDPNETLVRTAAINKPDPEGTLGLTSVETEYTGPTAEAHDYSSACS